VLSHNPKHGDIDHSMKITLGTLRLASDTGV
jgi:hypothetical protein